MRLPDAPVTPTVVFDLDGTLVDTVPDIAVALDTALQPYAVSQTKLDEAASMMGDGLSEFFWRALASKRLSLPAHEADQARRRFIEHYRQSAAKHSSVYPGIVELLGDLREAGAFTAVCTNKIELIAVDILQGMNLHHFFDAVIGTGDDRPMKPSPLPVLQAVARAGGRIERAMLVGDTVADRGAAIAAGIPLVLTDYGYNHWPVNALKYGTIVDSPRALRNAVMAFIGGEHYLGADAEFKTFSSP